MKKITIFFFLLFLNLPNYSQQINAIPSFWESSFWNGTGWTTISEVTYTFNSNCLPTEVLAEVTVNGVTTNVSLSITSYDSNSFATENITQIWNNSAWENSIKFTFTYTGNLITELTSYKWVSSAWELDTRVLNTYNGSNMIIENLSQSWVSSAWENTIKTETTYNGNNLVAIITNYTWATSSWENNSRVTNSYNGGNFLTTEETSTWSGAAWENDSQDTYTYDGSNFVIEILGTKWNGASYTDDSFATITNNASGYPIETINQTWQTVFWLNTSRTQRDYNECATLATEDYEEIITDVYPNPASNLININFKDSFNGYISIFDIQGKSLYTSTFENSENSIDLSQFAGGVYLLVAESENKRMVKRIVIEK